MVHHSCKSVSVIYLLMGLVVLTGFFPEISVHAADPVPFRTGVQEKAGDWKFLDAQSDEFDAAHIDRSKWNIDTPDFGPWSWEPENIKQQAGVLQIRMEQKNHRRGNQELYYTSGMARNDKTLTYGYFEARIKGCSRYPGACPSFWLYSIGPQNRFKARDGETVAYSEIDVVELQQCEFDFKTKKHFPVTRIDCNLHTTLMKEGRRDCLVHRRNGSRAETQPVLASAHACHTVTGAALSVCGLQRWSSSSRARKNDCGRFSHNDARRLCARLAKDWRCQARNWNRLDESRIHCPGKSNVGKEWLGMESAEGGSKF